MAEAAFWVGATKKGIASRRQDRSLIAGWIPAAPGTNVEVHASGTSERLTDLEAIVRAVAASNPAPRSNGYWCILCGRERENHAETCAYLQAQAWVDPTQPPQSAPGEHPS